MNIKKWVRRLFNPATKIPPKNVQPSRKRIELDQRAKALNLYLARERGAWVLCRLGGNGGQYVTSFYPSLRDVEQSLVKLEQQ